MARLAITKDVLSAFAKLDKPVQHAVQSAIADFASGDHGAGRLEKVPGSLDDRIRLLQVDDAWHGAVLVPDSGDTYVPLQPASHGCVRIPMDIATFFHTMVSSSGTQVYVYN